MAEKIRGITIEISADTNPLMASFKQMQSSLRETDKALKDVNKLLKFDSGNVTLLSQKQEYLNEAIAKARLSLKAQQELLSSMPTDSSGKLSEEQLALQRNIEETKQKLQGYETQLQDTKEKLTGASDETEKMKKGTKEAGEAMKDAGDKSKTFGDMLKANLTAEAIKAVGKAIIDVGKEIFNLGKEAAAYADDVLTLSTKFGVSTDKIQEFKYMAELTDTSLETITGSMTKLTNNMQTASKGSGDAYEAFKALGVSITDSNGQLRNSEVVFNEAIAALGNMDNETQRNAYAMKIFGKSAMDLNPLISAGGEAIQQYAEEAHQMGYVLDEETLSALGNVDDSMQRANNALQAVKTQIGAYLAPVVANITEAFAQWAMSVDWKKVGDIITSVINAIGKAINWLIPIVKQIIEWAVKAATAIKDMFTGKFEWPKIKMPHFSVTPKGWKIGDILKGSIPKLGIDWYAKGMDGMVLDGATVFGMNRNGQLMVGGERGREVVIGENNLMRAIRSAAGGTNINIVVNEAVNAQETANLVLNKLNFEVNQKGMAW